MCVLDIPDRESSGGSLSTQDRAVSSLLLILASCCFFLVGCGKNHLRVGHITGLGDCANPC